MSGLFVCCRPNRWSLSHHDRDKNQDSCPVVLHRLRGDRRNGHRCLPDHAPEGGDRSIQPGRIDHRRSENRTGGATGPIPRGCQGPSFPRDGHHGARRRQLGPHRPRRRRCSSAGKDDAHDHDGRPSEAMPVAGRGIRNSGIDWILPSWPRRCQPGKKTPRTRSSSRRWRHRSRCPSPRRRRSTMCSSTSRQHRETRPLADSDLRRSASGSSKRSDP